MWGENIQEGLDGQAVIILLSKIFSIISSCGSGYFIEQEAVISLGLIIV